MHVRIPLFALTLVSLAAGIATAAPPAVDTGIEPSSRLFGDGGRLTAYTLHEGSTDLNGDGDIVDDVVHVYDSVTGTELNTGGAVFAVHIEEPRILVRGSRVAFAVDESTQDQDSNGDGDMDDQVIVIYDAAGQSAINTRLATQELPVWVGDVMCVLVDEADQGAGSLNGDGDTADTVLHVVNARNGNRRNLAHAIDVNSVRIGGLYVAWTTDEAAHGAGSLNADFDTLDHIVHAYDIAADTITNLGVDGSIAGSPTEPGFFPETPLDTSGDLGSPYVPIAAGGHLQIYNAATGALTTVQSLHGVGPYLGQGSLVGFGTSEASEGDLNGDMDTDDRFLFVHDAATGATVNLGFWGDFTAIRTQRASGDLDETEYGVDGNADGLVDDAPFVFDFAAGTNTLLAVPGSLVLTTQRYGYVRVLEPTVAMDLNNDTDTLDLVLHTYDAATDALNNTELAVGSSPVRGRRRHLAFGVSEHAQSADGNGDGDELDTILVVANARNGNFANLRLAIPPSSLSDEDSTFQWSLSTLMLLVRDGVEKLYRLP